MIINFSQKKQEKPKTNIYVVANPKGLQLNGFPKMEYVQIIERNGKLVLTEISEKTFHNPRKKWVVYKVENNFIAAPHLSKIILNKNLSALNFEFIADMYISEKFGLTEREHDDLEYQEIVTEEDD